MYRGGGRLLKFRFAGLSIRKLSVRSRPNFGHCTETNTVIAAAAAFRRPSPLSERLQLGGKRIGSFQEIEANSSHSAQTPLSKLLIWITYQAPRDMRCYQAGIVSSNAT